MQQSINQSIRKAILEIDAMPVEQLLNEMDRVKDNDFVHTMTEAFQMSAALASDPEERQEAENPHQDNRSTVAMRPLEQVSKEAYALLFEHLGVTDTLRFINQYRQGQGDYIVERRVQLEAK